MTNTLERVHAARSWLLMSMPFLGYLTMRLRPRLATEADQVATAGVHLDGTLVLCDEWCAKLSDAEMRFVLCHEVMHPALDFWGRLGNRDFRLFNIAHDYAINMLVSAYGYRQPGSLEKPAGILYSGQYFNLCAEEIYERLKVECDQAKTRDGEKEPGDGPVNDPPNDPLIGDCKLRPPPQVTEPASAERAAREIREARQGWKLHLDEATQRWTPEERGRNASDLALALGPPQLAQVDWREALSSWFGEQVAQAMQRDYGYSRPSRRSESVGEILAAPVRQGPPRVTVIWDSSGSMVEVVDVLFAELSGIVDNLGCRTRLIVCDTQVHADIPSLRGAEDAIKSLTGGGGSDLRPAFAKIRKNSPPTVVVVFTDGYVDVPMSPPAAALTVLWVLVGEGPSPATWGDVLRLPAHPQ
jgi:predicted metal-dependent peptidase